MQKIIFIIRMPTTFDEIFKVTLVLFFIPDFNWLSYKLDNFTFKVIYWVILYWYYMKTNKILEHAVAKS